MSLIQKAFSGLGALTLVLALSGPARADVRNQLSYLTFSQPIQIPMPSGQPVVLQPGTYLFRVNTGANNHRVVRVYDKLQKHLFAQVRANETTFLAPTARDLTDHTVLTFAQGAPGQPLTLVKWYYPDSNWGHEFVYSGPVESQISEERPVTVVAQSAPLNLHSYRGEIQASNLH